MPRIILQTTEKETLLKIKKQKGNSDTIRDRAHAVLLRGEGFTIKNTAKALLRNEQFVKKAVRLYREGKITEIHILGGNHHNQLSKCERLEIIEIIKNKTPKELSEFQFKEQFWSTDILKAIIKKKYKIEYKTDKSYYDLFRAADFNFKSPKTRDFRQDPEKMKEFKGALKKSSTITKIRMSWSLVSHLKSHKLRCF